MIPDFYDSIKKPWGKDSKLFSFIDYSWELLRNKYILHNSESHYLNIDIPKIIHQIWLGGPIPDSENLLAEKIKDLHPDWSYILWTDHNLDFIEIEIRNKIKKINNIGVQSDIIRYLILEKYGGIYLDCDFIPIKKFDNLIRGTNFLAGICNPDENNKPCIANGLFASVPNHNILKNINLSIKNNLESYVKIENQIDIFNNTGPTFFTNEILNFIAKYPLDKIVIYPSSYFYPINYRKRNIINSKIIRKYTFQETYLIHLWNVSWFENNSNFKSFIKNQIPLRYLDIALSFMKIIKFKK
jgi:mannosyltransferase OCH1-like enzyme